MAALDADKTWSEMPEFGHIGQEYYDLILEGGVPLLDLTVQHGRTLEDASRGLEMAVGRVSAQFGPLVRRVEWAPDRHRVKLEGVGFWVEMWVDTVAVHATGDIPILGGLLGGHLASDLKQIVQQAFQKKLP
jgi:hypothetical protein